MRVVPLLLGLACAAQPVPATTEPPELHVRLLFTSQEPARWRPVHDGVMGGLSRGDARPADGVQRFAGQVSLENNGGFASFRAPVETDLTGFDGLSFRVRGDGQVYKLGVRTDGAWDGVSWQASFDTEAGAWTDVALPFEAFVPTWRGRLVREAGPLEPGSIRQLGVMISDKQAGPFALELDALQAYREEGPGPDGSRAAVRQRSEELAATLDQGAAAGELVEALRWSERILVVATPDDLDPRTSLQLGRLQARADALAARDLRVLTLAGVHGGRLAGRTLGTGHNVALRERWGLPTERWAAVLVGKDGGVKNRWDGLVGVDEICAQIDAMPMRRREQEAREDA